MKFDTSRQNGSRMASKMTDDLVPANLRGQKCPAVRKFQVGKFHGSTWPIAPAELVTTHSYVEGDTVD